MAGMCCIYTVRIPQLTTMAKMSPGVRHTNAGRQRWMPQIIVRTREKINMAGLVFGLGSTTDTWGRVRGWLAIMVACAVAAFDHNTA